MKYMLAIMTDEKTGRTLTPDAEAQLMKRHSAFYEALVGQKKLVACGRLEPENTGARVTVRGGRMAVMDGPFAETREVFGGFYVIEADSREEAIAWAARCPNVEFGAVEIRPLTGS